jgi:ubiquinone/menaquinone biosynthesis C-methylase UbiE
MTQWVDPADSELAALQQAASFVGQRVLEIGAGDGRLAWPLARAAAHWVALDPDPAELAARPDQFPIKQVVFAQGDGRALPFAAQMFDLAFFSWSLC